MNRKQRQEEKTIVKKNIVRQYTISECYPGNDKITIYENGKEVSHDIIPWYNQEGYLIALEDSGYERAYDISYYEQKVKEAEEKLLRAKEIYERAMKHPLFVVK